VEQILENLTSRLIQFEDSNQALEEMAREFRKLGLEFLLGLLDEKGERIVIHFYSLDKKSAFTAEQVMHIPMAGASFPITGQFFSKIFEEKKPVYHEDAFPIFQRVFLDVPTRVLQRAFRMASVASHVPMVSLPLLISGRVIGVLSVWGENLDESRVGALQALANQLAASWRLTSLVEALEQNRELYCRLIENNPAAMFIVGEEDILYANAAAVALTGAQSKEDLIGTPISRFVSTDSLRASSQQGAIEETFRRLDGILLHVLATGAPVQYGGHLAFQMVLWDISKRKKAEEEVEQQRAEFYVLSKMSREVTAAQNLEETLLIVLRYAIRHTRSDAGAFILVGDGEEPYVIVVTQGVLEETHRMLLEGYLHYRPGTLCAEILENRGSVLQAFAAEKGACPCEPLLKEGFRAVSTIPFRKRDTLVGILNLYRREERALTKAEIRFLEKIVRQNVYAVENAFLLKKLEHLATTDPLSGLYNRRQLMELGEREFERARRYQTPLVVMMLDIDLFKTINDTYGHESGDAVIRGIAEILRKNTREFDIAARYGGEEFVILSPGTDLEGGKEVAERLRRAIESAALIPGEETETVTVSIGVTAFSREVMTLAALIARADAALYEAKSAGRNRIAVR
jgi:diguanylate cyclase (GGDEF)-like protein/PAS domain S-box-containing protein